MPRSFTCSTKIDMAAEEYWALRLDKGVKVRWISPGGVHAHVAPGATVSGYGYDSSHVVFVNGR